MSIKNEEKILELLQSFHREKSDTWYYGNSVLYRMCEEKPLHDDKNIVASKV